MPNIAEYQQRLQSIYEDMFVSGLENWKDGDNGDSFDITNWINRVKDGSFIDYDGHGNFAFKRADGVYVVQKLAIKPSDITRWGITPPSWATHVIWYNR
jgi:hypothetical protein